MDTNIPYNDRLRIMDSYAKTNGMAYAIQKYLAFFDMNPNELSRVIKVYNQVVAPLEPCEEIFCQIVIDTGDLLTAYRTAFSPPMDMTDDEILIEAKRRLSLDRMADHIQNAKWLDGVSAKEVLRGVAAIIFSKDPNVKPGDRLKAADTYFRYASPSGDADDDLKEISDDELDRRLMEAGVIRVKSKLAECEEIEDFEDFDF